MEVLVALGILVLTAALAASLFAIPARLSSARLAHEAEMRVQRGLDKVAETLAHSSAGFGEPAFRVLKGGRGGDMLVAQSMEPVYRNMLPAVVIYAVFEDALRSWNLYGVDALRADRYDIESMTLRSSPGMVIVPGADSFSAETLSEGVWSSGAGVEMKLTVRSGSAQWRRHVRIHQSLEPPR